MSRKSCSVHDTLTGRTDKGGETNKTELEHRSEIFPGLSQCAPGHFSAHLPISQSVCATLTVRRRNRCANIKASRSNFASVMLLGTIRTVCTLPRALHRSTKMRLLPTVNNSQAESSELKSKPTKESFPLLSELDVISHHSFLPSTVGRDDPDSELLYRVDVRRAIESRDEQEGLDCDYRTDANIEDWNDGFTRSKAKTSTSSYSRRDPKEKRLPPAQQRPLSVQAKHTIALVL
jgi:hypothetical protein